MEESGTELLTREQKLVPPPTSSSFMGSISNRPLSLLALAALMISKSHVYSHGRVTPFVWNVTLITSHTHKHFSFVI